MFNLDAIIYALIIFVAALVFALFYYAWYTLGTIKTLQKNQAEWNRIKANISDSKDILEAYNCFIKKLPNTPFGKCYPRE